MLAVEFTRCLLIADLWLWLLATERKGLHDMGASIILAGRPEQDHPARPRGQRMARGSSCPVWEAFGNVGSSHHVSPERKDQTDGHLKACS